MRWFVAGLILIAACSQSDAPAPAASETQVRLSQAEVDRGVEACRTYVNRLCACAKTNSQLTDSCQTAKDIPETLRLSIEASFSKAISEKDRWKIIYNTRERIKTCIEKDNQLDPSSCPRAPRKTSGDERK